MNTTVIGKYSNVLFDKAEYNDVISLFTPTYNRALLLQRVYDCLIKQTSKRFVWIIVNDGSSDNTDSLCQQIVSDKIIPVLYINKENGGKHSAFKVALDACRTEYFQCMDDDDLYSEISVETFLAAWKKVGSQNDIGAIRTLVKYSSGEYAVTGRDISSKIGLYEDCTTLEMIYKEKSYQENWTCYKTSALKSIELFPENYWLSEKHNFFLESIWQGRFARKYKCRYLYIVLRTYTDDAEISLIRSNKSDAHYLNMFINTKFILDEQLDFISKSISALCKNVLMVEFLRNYLNIKHRELIRNTRSKKLKILYTLFFPMSLLGKTVVKIRKK